MPPSSLRSALTLAALVAAFGCAAAPRGAHSRLSSDEVSTYARLLQMADARHVDSALVRQALRSGSSAVRSAAALAVGQVHGTILAADLRALLTGRDTAVAANATYALGLLRDSGSVAALATALAAPVPVAVEAAWALGQIGEPARAQIERALSTQARPSPVTGELLLAAGKLRPVPIDVVTPHVGDSSEVVRWSAAYAIARPYAAAGVRSLLPLVRDRSAEVRAQVARGLSKQAAGDSLRRDALPALLALARDSSAHVRISALRSLGTYGAVARDAVVAATHDADANVRITAAQTLGPVLDATRKPWMDAWEADTGFMYRKSLLASAMSVDLVLPAADEDNPEGWRHFGDFRYRAAVAEAGANAPTILRMRDVSLPLVRDPDGRVRAAAYAALAPHADTAEQHPWRREFMYVALQDWDFAVRALAIGSLEGHATAAEVPRVLASYKLAMRDTVSDARIAAVRFIAAAWRRDSGEFSDSLRNVVRALPVPADPLVRQATGDASIFASWKSALPSAERPLHWYERKVRDLVVPALGGVLPRAEIVTARGSIVIELYARDAPLTVDNFLTLVRSGYYAGVRFHRVVPNFVAQDGDRRGDGNGGPSYTIRDELNRRRYDRGAVGMALSGPDTGGSQYFITLSPQPHLDGGYTAFGNVVAGYGALDALVQGDSISMVRVR